MRLALLGSEKDRLNPGGTIRLRHDVNDMVSQQGPMMTFAASGLRPPLLDCALS
jgi:hypothetical protein